MTAVELSLSYPFGKIILYDGRAGQGRAGRDDKWRVQLLQMSQSTLSGAGVERKPQQGVVDANSV